MDVREKLVELLFKCSPKNIKAELCGEKIEVAISQGKIADYLIAHGVTVQEWISVKDRLPNVDTNKSGYERKGVIVCVDGCSKKSVYRVYERACNRGKTVYRWKYPWDTISDENITHWCELPQPPKGE